MEKKILMEGLNLDPKRVTKMLKSELEHIFNRMYVRTNEEIKFYQAVKAELSYREFFL